MPENDSEDGDLGRGVLGLFLNWRIICLVAKGQRGSYGSFLFLGKQKIS